MRLFSELHKLPRRGEPPLEARARRFPTDGQRLNEGEGILSLPRNLNGSLRQGIHLFIRVW